MFFTFTEGGIIEREEFFDFINSARSLTDATRREYEELFLALLTYNVKASASGYYVNRLIKEYREHEGYKVISDASAALHSQKKIGKDVFEGYEGMRDIVLKGIYKIDRISAPAVNDGNVLEESKKIMEEYASLKSCKDNIATGFAQIDRCTGGMHPGELWLLIGFTAEGKTLTCINVAHHAAFKLKRNVVFLTNETVRSVVIRRLVSRHALELTGKGINLTSWKKKELDAESIKILKETLEDMERRKGEYGRFELAQIPSSATTDFISASLSAYQTSFNVDLCIVDSISLLQPKRQRQYDYTELNDILIDIKKAIVSHNKGKGVPLLAPWHVNRASWETAKKEGRYTKSSLARTAEAERQADVIVSILREEGDSHRLRGSIIKNRDGEELEELSLACDFGHGFVGDGIETTPFNFDDVLNLQG